MRGSQGDALRSCSTLRLPQQLLSQTKTPHNLPPGEYAYIPGYDGDYVIERDGTVYSLKEAQPELQHPHSNGCSPQVCLWKNNKRTRRAVGELLQEAFGTEERCDAALAEYVRAQYWDHPEVREWYDRELGDDPADAEVVPLAPAESVACLG